MPTLVDLRLNGRVLRPHRPVVAPLLGTRTVLTNSPWGFVSLWLKRERKSDALFFWNQAKEFHLASSGMPLESAPLLHYYSFMNAAKALLVAKGISFDPIHGVRAHNIRLPSDRIALSNEGVRILSRGVVASISTYLGETESQQVHTLQELLFNLPYIHRTYCLTFKTQPDMFIPLTDCRYVLDQSVGQAFLRADLSQDIDHRFYINRLPPSFVQDPSFGNTRTIRSATAALVSTTSIRTSPDRAAIVQLNRNLRPDLQYIHGSQTLWYIKGVVRGPRRLGRFPITLTLAAMHRLSEICRYRPIELARFLSGRKNWLLSEFIQLAADQFIDEIASELTGYQFLAPNVRPAS